MMNDQTTNDQTMTRTERLAGTASRMMLAATLTVVLAVAPSAALAQDAPQTAAPATADGADAFVCGEIDQEVVRLAISDELVPGQDGHYFRRLNDVEILPILPPHVAADMRRVSLALERTGKDLVVVPLPGKGLGNAEFLPDEQSVEFAHTVDQMRDAYTQMLDTLEGEGVLVARIDDILETPDLPDGFFLKRDFHWLPSSARLVAQSVAELVDDLPSVASVEKSPANVVAVRDELFNKASLYRVTSAACDASGVGEMLTHYEAVPVEESVDFLGGFLDDADAATIVLLGTSYSADRRFSFETFLRAATGLDIANYSLAGGGPTTALYEWAHGPLSSNEATKVVVWEFPNSDSVTAIGEQTFRQVVPAILGMCEADEAVLAGDYAIEPGGAVAVEELREATASIGPTYVSMTLSDPTVRAFDVTFDYADGTSEAMVLTRPEGLLRVDTLFVETRAENAALASLRVRPLDDTLAPLPGEGDDTNAAAPARAGHSGEFRLCPGLGPTDDAVRANAGQATQAAEERE